MTDVRTPSADPLSQQWSLSVGNRLQPLLCPSPQDPAALRCLLQQRPGVQVLGGVRSRCVCHDLQ